MFHLRRETSLCAGAMENWGLITFRETALLVTNTASVADRMRVAIVIAHEMAHLWFGTPQLLPEAVFPRGLLSDEICYNLGASCLNSVPNGLFEVQELRRSMTSKVWQYLWCPWKRA